VAVVLWLFGVILAIAMVLIYGGIQPDGLVLTVKRFTVNTVTKEVVDPRIPTTRKPLPPTPPPIRGPFVPLNKWGPHDRYRPRRRLRHGMPTTEPAVTSSTRPTTRIPPRNTVIPFWRAPIKHGFDHASSNQNSDHAQVFDLGLTSTPSFLGTSRQSPGKNDTPLTSTVPSQVIQTSFTLTTTATDASTSSHIPDNFKMPEAQASTNAGESATSYQSPLPITTIFQLVTKKPSDIVPKHEPPGGHSGHSRSNHKKKPRKKKVKKHEKSDFEGDHFMSRESIEIELMKILDNLERDYKEDDSEPFYNYA